MCKNSFKIILIISIILAAGFYLSSSVLAEETPAPPAIPGTQTTAETTAAIVSIAETINKDVDIKPEDLGISEPKLLPDNPFYFLKNFGRAIQEIFTFSPIKKASLKLKFTNEKLMEVKKIAQTTENVELIKKATENYQQAVEQIKSQVEKIKEKAKENPQVDSFLNKFIQQQTLHQKLLQKLEDQVPVQASEKIKEARAAHLEKFQDVMLKLEDRKEKITEKLDKILEEQKGSEFKEFKNLEVLKNLEEKVPEEAKEAIQRAEENTLKRLQKSLEKMSPEDQEKFKEYTEKISGEKEKQLEILENLKIKIKEAPETPRILELKEKLEEGKTKILEKIEEKLEKLNCPLWTPPTPGFCKEGRIIIKKDPKSGCLSHPICIIPGEIEIPQKPEGACITLWDPVCGKNGKTYSNKCFAKINKVEIAYEGECKEKGCQTDADCPQLRCGQAGLRCIGVKAKCIEEKCQVVPLVPVEAQKPELKTCKNLCGDGICQEIVCMAIDCPCPETKETCPADCK